VEVGKSSKKTSFAMTDKNDKPIVNFVVLQSVEDYVEKSGKFRTECASFTIPGGDSGGANTLFIPYCKKQRFDHGPTLNDYRGNGVFTPPEMGKRIEIMDFAVYREHFHDIHCPQPCRGYSDKRVVAPEKSTQQVSKQTTVEEDRSSWPDVILECQWPSLFNEPKVAAHTVRRRPWMLRHRGLGAVYNVRVRDIDFGEYVAKFPYPVRTLTDTATVLPIVCRKVDGRPDLATEVSSHDLESLIRNPPSGCDVWKYVIETDDIHVAEDEEDVKIASDDSTPDVEIPVTISYDDKNGTRFKIEYLLHYETCIEKGEMIRIGSIEKALPKSHPSSPAAVTHDKPPEKAAPQVPKQVADSSAGKWTRKEIITAVVVPLVVVLMGTLLAWITPEGRVLMHLDKPPAQQAPQTTPRADSAPPELKIESVSPNKPAENHATTDKVTAVVKPSSVVDWSDKHNWRKYLHTGMTRTDVRKIFGDPEKMRVFGTLETWVYGSGSIDFFVESGTPDGSLYSWVEPD
jgi:hypothetical protein